MEVRVVKEEKDLIVVEFRDKDKHTVPNLLVWELNKDDRVEMAGYRIDHPLKDRVEIVVKVKEGDPKEIIKETIEKINKKLDEFLQAWSKRE